MSLYTFGSPLDKLPGKMRLTRDQIAAIRRAAGEVFGEGSQVWLFGSRVDGRRRGGDIDLLVRPAQAARAPDLKRKVRFLGKLERSLGERRVDLLIETAGDRRPIVRLARETGVRL